MVKMEYRKILIVVLALILVVSFVSSESKNEEERVEFQPEKAQAKEIVEWVNGDRITTKPDGSVEVVPAEVFMSKEELEKLNEDLQKAQKIETFFRVNRNNAPLADYSEKFVEVANKYDLDYRLLPAIATMESSGGKSNFRRYNAWGWGNRSFNSFEEGIEIVGKGLKSGYIDKGINTIEEMAKIYCPPNATNWARGVNRFMSEIENIKSN